jgi:amino acid adenylation domain-containing protein
MVYVLQQLLTEAAKRQPQRPAVESASHLLTYRDLDRRSNKLARLLLRLGVGTGDRVGILAAKSADAVVGVYGALKAGACYVPLDAKAPSGRLSHIVRDSGTAVIVANEATRSRAAALADAVPQQTTVIELSVPGRGERDDASVTAQGAAVMPWAAVARESEDPLAEERAIETDLAYILYTSGSTGTPKGVMISHRNSLTFVEWAAAAAGLSEQDRVCSPAPLHFDLSVFDVFATCRAAACMTVLPDGAATFPQSIAKWLAAERVSVWYSVPSVLVLLARYGSLQRLDLSGLRTVIFAGEVFPPRHLARLMAELPHARYLNWYGPTETNVCTAFEVPAGWADAGGPVPIGKACANTEVFAVTSEGRRAARAGETGELYVRGPSVMRGYWGQQARTAEALVRNPLRPEYDELVYRTGDLVTLEPGGNYAYLGRRDSMVKIRGYRVELGEVEATLYRHPAIREAAVLPVADELLGTRLRAVVTQDGADNNLTCENVLDHCRQWLPSYMVPDIVEFRDGLPRTSTGKVDRAGLAAEPRKLEPAGDNRREKHWQTTLKGVSSSGDGHQRLHQPGTRTGPGAAAAGERDTTTGQRHS